jgi:hypothetical protein
MLYIMKRTQLYIDESLFSTLSLISRKRKTTVSDLVRRALEQVYGAGCGDSEQALEASFGLWIDRGDLPPTQDYVRGLRKGARLKNR